MKTAILVVDFGMSKVHTALIGLQDGFLINEKEVPYIWDKMADARIEIKPEIPFVVSQQALRMLLDELEPSAVEILGIGFSFFGDNFVLLDENCKPVSPLVAPGDWRAEHDMEDLLIQISSDDFAEITGLVLQKDMVFPRIYWFKKHQPEVFRKAKYIYSIQQYVLLQLGLEPLNDYSLAARRSVADLRTNEWSPRLMDILGIRVDQLGRIVKTATVAGRIDHYGDVKLPCELDVLVGGHDAMQGFVGLGCLPLGAPDMIGSLPGSYNLLGLVTDKYAFDTPNRQSDLWPGNGPVRGSYHYQMGNMVHPTINWFVTQFYPKGGNALNELSSRVVYDATCTARLTRDPLTGDGCYKGLSVNHTVVDLFTAIMEFNTFYTKEMLDTYIALFGKKFDVVRIGSGGSKADNLNQFKADLWETPIQRVRNRQASSVGVAINAAVGVQAYKSYEDAIGNMVGIDKIYYPNPEMSARYAERYRKYLEDIRNRTKADG